MLQDNNSDESVEKFKCPYCETYITSQSNLWIHIKRSHTENMEEFAKKYQRKHFKCEYCEKYITSKRNLWQHIRRSHKENMEEYADKYQIKHLGLGLKRKDSMECPHCDKIFTHSGAGDGKHRLWKHIQTSHTEYAEDYARKHLKRYFHCPDVECSLIFIDHGRLQKHAKEHHSITIPSLNPEVECPFCDETFKNNSHSLGAAHVETQHLNERDNPLYAEFMAKYKKSWVCQECGHVLNNFQAFHKHMKDNHPYVEYKKSEKYDKYLKTSKSKENNKEQEESGCLCIQCGKTFRNTLGLNHHIKITHQERAFSCPECFKMFPTNSRLNKHVKTIHLNQRNYECDKCGKRFSTNTKLVQHIQAIHDKLKPYLCELCPFECARVTNLNIHRNKSHGVKEIVNKTKLIAQVKRGEHPYYNEEKFQMLLIAQ